MKKLSVFLIAIGLLIISIASYDWMQSKSSQKESLAEAHAMLSKKKPAKPSSTTQDQIKTFSPDTGDTVGLLYIPRLDKDLPIVEGTDEDELAKGVGHYAGTAYPLQHDQIVLSGHRDTVFRHMGELELGDSLTIKLPYGEFSYEITNTEIVDADDLTIISPTAPKEVLTLTTCYPFSYIGNAPERYIITALPVDD